MTLRVVIDAGEKLDLADELREEFVAEAKAAVTDASQLLLSEVQRLLRMRKGTRATVAPAGEPPEEHTGELANSFRVIPATIRTPVQAKGYGAEARSGIRSNHPGGNRLEFGFTDIRGVRTLPHPFIAPAIKTTEGAIEALLQERLG
jgi:hypothetical protein